MNPSLVDDLLDQADHLASLDPRKPKQISLRRAVSTAYYAVFHQVADDTVACVLSAGDARSEIGSRLRRTIQHGSVKIASEWFLPVKNKPGTTRLPEALSPLVSGPVAPQLVAVCRRFVELQVERHHADYNLYARPYSRAEANRLVREARSTVQTLRTMPDSPERTVFLLGCLLGKQLTKNL